MQIYMSMMSVLYVSAVKYFSNKIICFCHRDWLAGFFHNSQPIGEARWYFYMVLPSSSGRICNRETLLLLLLHRHMQLNRAERLKHTSAGQRACRLTREDRHGLLPAAL